MTGADPSARIRRLLWPGQRLTRTATSILALVTLAAPTIPAAAAFGPALAISAGVPDRPAKNSDFVHH